MIVPRSSCTGDTHSETWIKRPFLCCRTVLEQTGNPVKTGWQSGRPQALRTERPRDRCGYDLSRSSLSAFPCTNFSMSAGASEILSRNSRPFSFGANG